MKLPMSDAEIAMRYRNALDPKKAIKILAQLNGASPSDIKAALARVGILPETSTNTGAEYHPRRKREECE